MILAAFVLIALLTLALVASVVLVARDLATSQPLRPASMREAKLPLAA